MGARMRARVAELLPLGTRRKMVFIFRRHICDREHDLPVRLDDPIARADERDDAVGAALRVHPHLRATLGAHLLDPGAALADDPARLVVAQHAPESALGRAGVNDHRRLRVLVDDGQQPRDRRVDDARVSDDRDEPVRRALHVLADLHLAARRLTDALDVRAALTDDRACLLVRQQKPEVHLSCPALHVHPRAVRRAFHLAPGASSRSALLATWDGTKTRPPRMRRIIGLEDDNLF
eukprot:scaffold125858_cov51-Phaeocystis_antarctica.AAC.1